MPGPSGVSLDVRHRNHHRAAGARRGHQRRHGASPASGWRVISTARASRCSTTIPLRAVRRRLHDGGRQRRSGFAGRPLEAFQPVLDLRQQPHHHRRQHVAGPSAKTWPRASSAYGWNVMRVGDANDLEMLARALSTRSRSTTDRPTLIIVDSHIAYGAPQQAGHQRRARRAAGRRRDPADQDATTAGRRTPSSWCRTACTSISRTLMGKRGKEQREAWMAKFEEYSKRVSGAGRPSAARCSTASCRTAGTRIFRSFPPMPRAWPAATLRRKVQNAIAQARAVADRRLRRPGAFHQDAPYLRRRGRFHGRRITAAAISTSASANTPWARS